MTAWQDRALLGLAVAGILGSTVALALDAHAALAAWLAAAVAVSAVPIGSLAVLFCTYLMRRTWTYEMHTPLAAAALTIPVCGLLFIPVMIGIPWLYPWARVRPEHAFQAIYLLPWTFVIRSVIYFVIWSLLAIWARQASNDIAQMRRAASVGLIVYALTGSLAAVDWIESLTPDFHSSIYGLLFVTFQLLAGLSFAIAFVIISGQRSAALSGYGALLLATVLLWAYMHAMQYIIIWSGNIPDEIEWYIRRLTDGWAIVFWGLIFFQFIIPFFVMLPARARRSPKWLLTIAVGTLALRFVESCLLILPAADVSMAASWLAVPAATVAVVGIVGTSLRFTLRSISYSPPHAGGSFGKESV
jgi:hypothetical protein